MISKYYNMILYVNNILITLSINMYNNLVLAFLFGPIHLEKKNHYNNFD